VRGERVLREECHFSLGPGPAHYTHATANHREKQTGYDFRILERLHFVYEAIYQDEGRESGTTTVATRSPLPHNVEEENWP